MEMDSLNSVKCQKSRRRDTLGIYKIVNEEKTKDEQCSSSPKDQTSCSVLEVRQWAGILIF